MQVDVKKDINALDCDNEGYKAVICGNDLLEIYQIADNGDKKFTQLGSLYSKKRINWQDVSWNRFDDSIIAVGASNKEVSIKKIRESKLISLSTYNTQMERSVNSVQFHHKHPDLLLASSQAEVAIFDIRQDRVVFQKSKVWSVKSVRWNPHREMQFAACLDNYIEICDIALASGDETVLNRFPAHNGPVVGCDWHPTESGLIASGGRDSYVKVWDLNEKNTPIHSMLSVECLYSVKWRPNKPNHLISTSAQGSGIIFWDIHRPYVPFAYFEGTPTIRVNQVCFHRRNNPKEFISVSADQTLRHHSFCDSISPENCTTNFLVKLSNSDDVAVVARADEPENRQFSKTPSSFAQKSHASYQSQLDTTTRFSETVSGLNHCLQNYVLDPQNPSWCCLSNGKTARSVNLSRVAEAWEMLSYVVADNREPKKSVVAISSDLNSSDTQLPDSRDPFSSSKKLSSAHNFDDNMTRTWTNLDQLGANEPHHNQILSMEPYPLRHELQSDTQSDNNYNATETEDEQFMCGITFSNALVKSAPLLLKAQNGFKNFAFDQMVYNLLAWMVDSGDLQFVISAIIVLQNVINFPSGELLFQIKEWVIAYHELLLSMSLYVEACSVVKSFPMQQLREKVNKYEREQWDAKEQKSILNDVSDKSKLTKSKSKAQESFTDSSETVKSLVFGAAEGDSEKPMEPEITHFEFQDDPIIDSSSNTSVKINCCGSLFEGRCKKCFSSALCALCRRPVKSLYAWCQGCGHGGHITHMYEWYSTHKVCPAQSCGHHCEYS